MGELTRGTVTPAFRDYNTAEEAIKAFSEGKEFYYHSPDIMMPVQLHSIRDWEPGSRVGIRYKRKTEKVMYIV